MLVAYMKATAGESRNLMREPEEVTMTVEQERIRVTPVLVLQGMADGPRNLEPQLLIQPDRRLIGVTACTQLLAYSELTLSESHGWQYLSEGNTIELFEGVRRVIPYKNPASQIPAPASYGRKPRLHPPAFSGQSLPGKRQSCAICMRSWDTGGRARRKFYSPV